MPTEFMPELDQLLIDLRNAAESSNLRDYQKIKEELKNVSLKWDFGKYGNLKKAAKLASEEGIKKGAGYGISTAYTVPVASGGIVATGAVFAAGSLAPVLAVWIGAAQVAKSAQTSFRLWDLVSREKGGGGLYKCTCGKCEAHAYYLAERHDIGVAKFGASLFMVPLLYTVPEKLYNVLSPGVSARKRLIAHDLWQSARPSSFPALENETYRLPSHPKGNKVADASLHNIPPPAAPNLPGAPERRNAWLPSENPSELPAQLIGPGCRKAQAIIASLCKELSDDRTKYSKTLATILSADGVKALASKIYD
ncbi:hypothetical protein [Herbaspirillum sp. SJZ107]|uniref:hypothetical protein n=1 Tax=Herbaspirillum sp. SJZ107 TaxID=2572881 RepID=UPI00114E1D4C|nr:hypothetical protein [Herbaspirillum sp. SJZ107]TQK08262.1 hypothetical protein FBX97_3578 [Herbaspirillum sp. SJZ107]